MTDIVQLVNRWKDGDQTAAESLYDYHRNRCYRLAYGLLGNGEDAEEVAQDALTYALVNIERYDPGRAQFSTWLHTIVVSRSRDRQRRKKFDLVSLTNWMQGGGDAPSGSPTPEQYSETLYNQESVVQAVKKLPHQLREAVILRYWAGHSFREMSEIMNCPIGTAQSRVRRAFEKLRVELTPTQLIELNGEQA